MPDNERIPGLRMLVEAPGKKHTRLQGDRPIPEFCKQGRVDAHGLDPFGIDGIP